MPSLRLIVASGTGQRRLLEETVNELEKKGYLLAARQEGGEWVALLSDNMSGGLFDENRLIVVDSAALLGVLPHNLDTMVETESQVIIILVYDTDPSKFFSKDTIKKCTILRPSEFPRWPRERQAWVADAARGMKINMSAGAVAMLVEHLDDPEEIRAQLTSLSMLKRSGAVTADDVSMLCLDDGSRNLLHLLDALCTGDYFQSLRSLNSMISLSRNTEIIPIVSALHNRMRLAWYYSMYPRNGALFAKSLGAKDYAWKMAVQASRKYSADVIGRFVKGLIKINISEKSGTGAGWASLETLVIELVSAAASS
jgi:DNA polymerase-3 subunit delta